MKREYKRKNARIQIVYPDDYTSNIRKATFIFMKKLWKELEWDGNGNTSRGIKEK